MSSYFICHFIFIIFYLVSLFLLLVLFLCWAQGPSIESVFAGPIQSILQPNSRSNEGPFLSFQQAYFLQASLAQVQAHREPPGLAVPRTCFFSHETCTPQPMHDRHQLFAPYTVYFIRCSAPGPYGQRPADKLCPRTPSCLPTRARPRHPRVQLQTGWLASFPCSPSMQT